MLPQPENLSGVAADAFENAVSVEQAVVVDADFGVFLVVELPTDVDLERHGRENWAVGWLCGLDSAIGQPDHSVGQRGYGGIVRNHDYSHVLLLVQGAQNRQDLAPVP